MQRCTWIFHCKTVQLSPQERAWGLILMGEDRTKLLMKNLRDSGPRMLWNAAPASEVRERLPMNPKFGFRPRACDQGRRWVTKF
jgi:hypothetical protein